MAIEIPYFFFADAIQRDPATHKLMVGGLFNVVTCTEFPSMLYNCFVVVGVGGPEINVGDEFFFRVEDPDGKEVGRSQALSMRSRGAVVNDLIVRFQNVLLSRQGEFPVLFYWRNNLIARRRLAVVKREVPPVQKMTDRGIVEL